MRDILDAIGRTSPSAVIAADRNNRIIAINRKAERLFGKTAAAMMGSEIFQALWSDHCRSLYVEAVQRAEMECDTLQDPCRFNCAIRDDQGEQLPVEVAVSCVAEGAERVALLYIRDNSDRAGRDAETARTIDRAERANAMKSRIVGMLAHDMRTALGGVLGASALLHNEITSSERDEIIAAIRASAETLSVLLEDAIAMAHKDAGHIEIRPVPVRIRDFMAEIFRIWVRDFSDQGVTLQSKVAPDVPQTLTLDPDRLRQIIGNLLSNVGKYAGAQNVCVSVSLEADNDILVSVADDGVGFGEEALRDAFEPFRRPEGQKAGGSGLGLSIVRTISRRMGGTVQIETSGGLGARVAVRLKGCVGLKGSDPYDMLPLPEETEAQICGVFEDTAVLLVEDNATNRLIATRMLEKLGLRVSAYETGMSGLEAARNRAFGAIVMDIDLPDIDGSEVIRRIRGAVGPNRQAPIIAFTAFAMPEQQKPIYAAGADVIVSKPVRSAEEFAIPLRDLGLVMRTTRDLVPQGGGASNDVLIPDRLDELRKSLGALDFAELAAAFASDLDKLRADLEGANISTAELRRVSHVAISVTGAIGADAATGEAEALNRAANEEDLKAMRFHQTQLHEALLNTITALDTYRETHR